MRRICVYCGSNTGARPLYADAARELAEVLVRHDLELVYGGADKGLMGIIADSVLEQGGTVHGVIPKLLYEKGNCAPGSDGTARCFVNACTQVDDGSPVRRLHSDARWFRDA